MNEIECNICGASFEPKTVEIHNRVITQDEFNQDIYERYYNCPYCEAHYTITVTDRQQSLAIQRRKQLQTSAERALRSGMRTSARTYLQEEKEIAEDIKARAKSLKEKYKEYLEE